ncbi:hypothetical protein PVAND_008886 [Polypedilum vanderplanki]|uniref:RHD domain-containing protein n=1 Tax=Polypedilum vanderplanki TaxID=319348 RepID=A0A9J6CBL8_POLVA|nr:hypothetical protein PVAND_008886 [Polypedilum vanderplanki]
MDIDEQKLLWSLLEDDDRIINENLSNSSFMPPYYSPPRSHLSTISMDSGVESPSHSANNQQNLTDDSQHYFHYNQPTSTCYNNNPSINTQNFQNVLPMSNTFTISYPSDICGYGMTTDTKRSLANLKIIEEPKTIFRFRYETEMQGPHGMIQAKQHNKNQKVFPTVALENFDGNEEVMIRCTLHQYKNENNEEVDFLHPHKLIMRSGGSEVEKNGHDPHYVKVTRQNDFTAVFQGLGIIQTKKDQMEQVFYQKLREEKEFEVHRQVTEEEDRIIKDTIRELMRKKININQVRLGYTAYIRNPLNNTWTQLCGPIFSSVINNKKSGKVGDLKICRMSTHTSEADGNQEIFMFVSKVDKNTIKVRFYETEDGEPYGKIIWSCDGKFSPSDVHHQFGIVLKTPPYKDRFINSNVKVFIQLCRSSDGETSEPLEFIYKPNNLSRKKRPRSEGPNIPTAVEDYESANRNFSQSNIAAATSYSNVYGNQFFTGSTSSNNEQQEETEAELNVLLRIVTSELCSEKLADCELIKYCLDLGNESELAIDAAEPGQQQKPIDPIELDLSVLEKLKMIMKLFKDNYDEEKIRDMMLSIIKAAEERDENLLIDVIQYETMNDIKDLILILLKYKLNDVLQSKNDIDQNALHLSILLGYTNLLKVFIKCGVNVNEADAFGLTPLHLAVKRNSTNMVQVLLGNAENIELNALDDNGNSALNLSVENNNLEIIKLLINAGADIKIRNPTSGFTCLHTAINNQIIDREIIKYLIEVDATLLSIKSNNGKNILGMAHINNLPNDLIEHLSSFYNTVDNNNAEDIFDEECFDELCKIFDENDNWERWAIIMDLADKTAEFASFSSPSGALLKHLLNNKCRNLQDFIELLNLIEDDIRNRATNAIDEMTVRKFSQ